MEKKEKILIVFVLINFFIFPFSFAQIYSRLDSLKIHLSKLSDNSPALKAKYLIEIGKEYMNSSKYLDAMNYYQKALKISQNIKNDTLLAESYKCISIIEFYHQNFDKVYLFDFKALQLFKKIDDKYNVGIMYKNLGDDYLQQGKVEIAEKYFELALPILIKYKDKINQAAIYANQGIIFQKDARKSIELELKAKKIWDQYPTSTVLPLMNIGNIGVAYLDLVRYERYKNVIPDSTIPASLKENLKRARLYLKKAILMGKERKDRANESYFTGLMAELDAFEGNYKNAYEHIRFYYDTQDSIFSQDSKNKIAALENQNILELKNKEIQLKAKQILDQKRGIGLMSGLIISLFLIGLLFYRQSIIRKRTNKILTKLNSELDKANALKAKFFGILSHDLRSPIANLVNFLHLQKTRPEILSQDKIALNEKRIEGAVESLLQNMESILLWSKGQMEHFEADYSQILISNIFDYLKSFFGTFEEIRFEYILEKDFTLVSDENYLQCILQNLISNSIKALKNTQDPIIIIKAWQINSLDFISVSDNGPGAANDQLKPLLEETELKGMKHGLGLHIIRDLAKGIRCKIQIKQLVPQGLEFILSINQHDIPNNSNSQKTKTKRLVNNV